MNLPYYAPKEYFLTPQEVLDKITNGCGAKGGIPIPDTMYGLKVCEPCNRHDFMYHYGKTHLDKIFADVILLYNTTATILNKGGWLTIPRLARATKYFIAVVERGEDAYAENKTTISNKKTITFQGEFR